MGGSFYSVEIFNFSSILLTLSWRGEFLLVISLQGETGTLDSPSGGGTVLVHFLCRRNCPSEFPPREKGEGGGDIVLVNSLQGEKIT